MHILLIHQVFAALDEAGGTRHHEFARYLAAHGHQVTVITSPVSYLSGQALTSAASPAPLENEPGVTVMHASNYRALHKSFIHRFLFFVSFMASSFWAGLKVREVDVVWGTSPPIFQGLTAWALARLKRVPFLFEVRDLWPQFAIAVGVLKNPLLIKLSLGLEHFLYRAADRVMVNSPGYVEHVTRGGARDVALIPNGADPAMFDPSADGKEFRALNGLEGRFVVLYAGAHGMSNDLGIVLQAARLLAADSPQVRLVLLGDGKEKPTLEAQAAQMRLENVLFLPPVPKTAMPAALAGADACLAILKPIDEYKKPYPNKVFDYMAAGRPVLLAIDGVIREVVEQAACGIFVPPGDSAALAQAIRMLAADPEEARRMGLAGRLHLEEHFSREKTARDLLAIFTALVENNPHRRNTKASSREKGAP
jgi:glycosyltransferase involved in cell wall biosynthesis